MTNSSEYMNWAFEWMGRPVITMGTCEIEGEKFIKFRYSHEPLKVSPIIEEESKFLSRATRI